MYFRIKKTKTTPALQLVHSFRNKEGDPRQKVLLSFGNIDIPKELWKPIVEEVENIIHNTLTLFPPKREIKEWAEKIVSILQNNGNYSFVSGKSSVSEEIIVDPSDIYVENVRELGPELVAKKAFESLGLDEILCEEGFSPILIRNAALTLINRICEPVSEHALPEWIKTTALEDLFQTELRKVGDDRFHRISDKLFSKKETIEKKLSEKEQNLFNLDRSIYLYDLTNTYFEGIMKKNELALRGHSKEKRTDAPLVSCGLVLDKEGFIIQHKVYRGNIGETKTLEKVLDELSENNNIKPTIIMDSGISSKANIEMIKEKGFDYITVGKRPSRNAYKEIFQDLNTFRKTSTKTKENDLLIKTFEKDDERMVACISETRKKKEKAILSNNEKKYLTDLEKLQKSIVAGRIKDKIKILKKLGRLEEKYSRSSRYYEVNYDEENRIINFFRKDLKYETAMDMSGGYLIKTSRKDLSDEQIWKLYIMLTKVESSFRTLKSQLGLRPIYHQTEKRCKGHIFLTILAYHLLHWIETKLKRNKCLMSWRTARRILQTHCYQTIVIPAKNGNIIRIRKPSRPDVSQTEIYRSFGIDLKKLHITKLETVIQ